MGKGIRSTKLWVSSALSIIVVMSSVSAFASERGRDSGHDRDRGRDKGREIVVVDRHRYSYHDGRFFRPGLFGFEIALLTPPFGAVVASVPVGRRTVLVGGASYYYYDNVYYKPVPSGYVVVPPPVAASVVSVPYSATQSEVVVNVFNSDGSFTPIALTKRGNGYVGPQGEYYPEHPTVDQLKALYAR